MQDKSFSKMSRGVMAGFALMCLAGPSFAQDSSGPSWVKPTPRPSLNFFGETGLIDMPTGESQPVGELNITSSYFRGALRNTLNFQITNRLSGSFRYSIIPDYNIGVDQYDRSFDLRFRVLDETKFLPSVTVGLRDFGGTGIYGSEYVAATKNLTPKFKVTAGLGWGRLGSENGFSNPLGVLSNGFKTRPGTDVGRGGVPDVGRWFRGDAAVFGGIEWITPVKGLTFKAEYSSDAYRREIRGRIAGPGSARRQIFERKSSVNFGLEYQVSRTFNVGAYYLYGSEFGLKVSIATNPGRPGYAGSREGAPLPIQPRPVLKAGQQYSTAWTTQEGVNGILQNNIQNLFDLSGLKLDGLKVTGTRAEILLRNDKYDSEAQAIGRAARAMARALPASVNEFVITPVVQGLPVASVTLRRSDIEAQENNPDGAANLLAAARIENGPRAIPAGTEVNPEAYRQFSWSIGPYSKTSFFDPDSPFRIQVGVRARGRWDLGRGLSVTGAVTKRIAGNLRDISRVSNSVLPRVRSDASRYFQEGDPALERLTADYLFKLSPDVYGRLSAGYLENMYGGVSAEVLWKPVGKRFALGAELNYVKQRDFDQRFGFQNYDVLTGHVSGYYKFDNGFDVQVDLGRYLAGDIGGTFALNRTFDNGWKIGAFFTLTDVPFEDFGEGSFDKGITLSIPLSWNLGKPIRKSNDIVIRPLTRDGGARLNVANRLYPMVSDYDRPSIESSWGRVLR